MLESIWSVLDYLRSVFLSIYFIILNDLFPYLLELGSNNICLNWSLCSVFWNSLFQTTYQYYILLFFYLLFNIP